MIKSLFVAAAIALVSQASTSPLAFVVLDANGWEPGKVPPSWSIKVNHGRPEFSPCTDSGASCLHLRSDKASFALERGIDLDPAQMPFLSWRWKVTKLPDNADFRRSKTDDQAAQVLVAFADRRVISYIWDSSAPVGSEQKSGFIPLVSVYAIVCQSGPGNLHRWVQESRNVAADYARAYGRPAPRVKGVRLQINSQHTGSLAESYFSEVAFRNSPQ